MKITITKLMNYPDLIAIILLIFVIVIVIVYNSNLAIYRNIKEGSCSNSNSNSNSNCYNEGAVVLDPDQCCGVGTIKPETVNNPNIYAPTYLCGASQITADPNYNRISQCYNSPAVRSNKSDCCNGAVGNISTNKNGDNTYIYTCS